MNNSFSWKSLEYDTKLFGFHVAKIEKVETNEVTMLINDLQNHSIQYATYRAPSDNIKLIHALELHRFILVDGFIKLEYEYQESKQILNENNHVRLAQASDISALRKIAQTTFTHNRFFNDLLIPKDKANKLFGDWIENSVLKKSADSVYVYEEASDLLGFTSIKKAGEIPLIAVEKNAQGKGVARHLISHTLYSLKNQNPQLKVVSIDTQIQNIPALRAYIRSGFLPTKTFLTYRWSDLS